MKYIRTLLNSLIKFLSATIEIASFEQDFAVLAVYYGWTIQLKIIQQHFRVALFIML